MKKAVKWSASSGFDYSFAQKISDNNKMINVKKVMITKFKTWITKNTSIDGFGTAVPSCNFMEQELLTTSDAATKTKLDLSYYCVNLHIKM